MFTKSLVTFVSAFVVLGGAGLFSTKVAAEAGPANWKPLFNGANLDGFHIQLRDKSRNEDPDHLVQVTNGMLHFYKDAPAGSAQPFGYVATDREFTNYHLRLEFKWGEKKFAPRARAKRDSGLLYHVIAPDKVWPASVEYQIQEGDVGDTWTVSTRVTADVDARTTNLTTTVSTNKTTGVVRTNRAAQPAFLETGQGGVPFIQGEAGTSKRIIHGPSNEKEGWNLCEVIVNNGSAVHILNGKVVNRCREFQQKAEDGWLPLRKGKIALQLEGSEVIYRSIEVRELVAE